MRWARPLRPPGRFGGPPGAPSAAFHTNGDPAASPDVYAPIGCDIDGTYAEDVRLWHRLTREVSGCPDVLLQGSA